MAAESAPSASSQRALVLSPASASKIRSGTPVYSTQWTMPWVYWQPLSWAPRHSIPEFAAHSRK
jgi:hypothetical protein